MSEPLTWDTPDLDVLAAVREGIQEIKDTPPYYPPPPCKVHVPSPSAWREAQVRKEQGHTTCYAQCANCFGLVDLLAPATKNP